MLRRMRAKGFTKGDDSESIDASALERDVQSVQSGESGSVYGLSRRSAGSVGSLSGFSRRGILKSSDDGTAPTSYSSDSPSSPAMNGGRRRRARSVPRRNQDFRFSRSSGSSVASASSRSDRRSSDGSRHNRLEEDRRYSNDGRRNSGEGRRHRSEDRRHSGEDRRYSGEDRRYSGEDRGYSGEDRRYRSEDRRYSGEDRRHSGEDRRYSDDSRRYSGEDHQYSDEGRRYSGDDVRYSSSEVRRYSGDSRRSGNDGRGHGGDLRRSYDTGSLPDYQSSAAEPRGRRQAMEASGPRPRRSRSLQSDQPRHIRSSIAPPRTEQRHRVIVTPDGNTQILPEAVLIRGPATTGVGSTPLIRNNNNNAIVSPVDCATFGQQTSVRSFDSRNTDGGISSLASMRSRETLEDVPPAHDNSSLLSPTHPPSLLNEHELRDAWSTFEDVSTLARLSSTNNLPLPDRQVADIAGCTLRESRRALFDSGGDANLAVLSLLSLQTGASAISSSILPQNQQRPVYDRSESAELAEMGGISVLEARSRLFDTGGDLTAAKVKLMGNMFGDAVG